MFNRFLSHIKEDFYLKSTDVILIAVSGGVDSMVLLDLFDKSEYQIKAAHFDHLTRNGQSTKDAEFVEQYCKKRGIPLYIQTIDKRQKSGNFQAEARYQRYTFFKQLECDKIATAHHKDDNLETIFLNFINGRSTQGIPSVNNKIIRPLMIFTKEDILQYAQQNNIPFVEDASNFESHYDRNFLRNEIIPKISSKHPELSNKVIGLSTRQSENDKLLNQLVEITLLPIKRDDKILINKSHLRSEKINISSALAAYLKPMGFTSDQALSIINGLDSIGIQFLSSTHQLVVDRDQIIITKSSGAELDTFSIDLTNVPICVTWNNCNLVFEKTNDLSISTSTQVAQFDASKLGTSIIVRSWQEGDRFYPLNMDGKKQSLKKLFVNHKVDLLSKRNIPIFLNGEDIIWVGGLRQDDRYKVTEKTTEVLKIEIV